MTVIRCLNAKSIRLAAINCQLVEVCEEGVMTECNVRQSVIAEQLKDG
jgi:hypothetical protein